MIKDFEDRINPRELRPVSLDDPAVKLYISQSFSRIGMSIFEILLIGTAAQILLVLLMQKLAPGLTESSLGMLIYSFVPIYVIAMPVGIKMLMRADAYAPERKKLGLGAFLTAFCICFFLMYAGNIAGTTISNFLSGGQTAGPLDALIENDALIPKFIIVVIIGPVMEEFIFRKLLIDRMSIYGERLAIVTSALLFGLFHGNIPQFCYATLLGLVWGYIYTRTGNIGYSIIMHMLINFIGSVTTPYFMSLMDPETLRAISEETDPERIAGMLNMGTAVYLLFLFLASTAGFILLILVRRRLHFEPAALELPREGLFRTVWLNKGMTACLVGCIALMIYSQIVMGML